MHVDVATTIVIDRPRAEVAAFAAKPENAPAWYVNIKRAERKSDKHVAFTAHFLGRQLEYTYEIVVDVPGERLVMRTAEGPFPMETTYTFESVDAGRTRMTLRNRGEPTGFASLMAPLMKSAMKRATTKDLARLKALLESLA